MRRRLHGRLDEGAGRALTLVAAGPGFGKSTLLAAWCEQWRAAGRDVAWLSLSETEDDAVVLCSCVVEAIRHVRPGFGEELRASLTMPAVSVADVLRALVNALAGDEPLAIVLDDFHRLGNPEALAAVAWLVEHRPAQVQIVLATRVDPMLPLSALRAHGELVELRASDLALTPVEAQEFLNDRLGLELAPAAIAMLVERMEGWPAGLYLAALSLRNAPRSARDESVRVLRASRRHPVDFLVDEVLRREPPDVQAFLLRSSVLERMSGPLCDYVLEREGSSELLASLWASNLFLAALGGDGAWYRFHRLFADVLRSELSTQEPGVVVELHRRAATWFREQGEIEPAVSHALGAGAFDLAGDLIAEGWVGHQGSVVRTWLQRLPADVVVSRPALLRAESRATAHALHTGSGGFLDVLRARYPDGPDPLLGELLARSWGGDAAGSVAAARRIVAAESPESPFWPEACELLGWCLYVADQADESAHWLRRSYDLARAAGQGVVAACAAAELSILMGERGHREEQSQLAEESYRRLVDDGLANIAGYEGVVHTACGISLAAQGRDGDALPALERGLALRPPTRFQLLDAIVPLIGVVRRAGDRQDAVALLAEARNVLQGCADAGGFRRRLAAVERSFDQAAPRRHAPDGGLSAAELRVLRLLAAGLSEREVAGELFVSFNTVHGHVKSIYRKLRVSSRRQALEAAGALGVI